MNLATNVLQNCLMTLKNTDWTDFPVHNEDSSSLTSLLYQDEHQTSQDLQDFSHDHSRRGKEMFAGQGADISDAEDERCVLDHQDRQADILQPLVHCNNQHELVCYDFMKP